jgi:hypothetical protein
MADTGGQTPSPACPAFGLLYSFCSLSSLELYNHVGRTLPTSPIPALPLLAFCKVLRRVSLLYATAETVVTEP